jgi:putative ABC transport system permease protein
MKSEALVMIFRHAIRNKFMVLISLFGLAISLTAVILISLFINKELSYDKHFTNIDNCYKMEGYAKFGADSEMTVGQVSTPIPPGLASGIPEIEKFLRIRYWENDGDVFCNNKTFNEKPFYFVDSTFFDFFSYKLIAGDPKTVLRAPDEIVITESGAKKYFGDTDPLGQKLTLNTNMELTIVGVMEDWINKSHLPEPFFVGSWTTFNEDDQGKWLNRMNFTSYFMMNKNADMKEVTRKANELKDAKIGEMLAMIGGVYDMSFRPMADVHLYGILDNDYADTRSIYYLYQFGAIGLFVLLIACLNFVNLSTATSTKRGKLVGICKALGATRERLYRRFILESILYSIIASLIAVVLAVTLLPTFEYMTASELDLSLLLNPSMIIAILLFSLIVGTAAGAYPAFFLSSFEPIHVLKGKLRSGAKGGKLRSSLVVLQFVISIVLITSSLLINSQMNFVRTQDLGFDKEQVMVLDMGYGDMRIRSPEILERIKTIPGVISAAGGNDTPFSYSSFNIYHIPGRPLEDQIMIRSLRTRFDYIETLGMKLIDGRDFDLNIASDVMNDSSNNVIINESLAKALGYEHPVGGKIEEYETLSPPTFSELNIIGVVADFHIESFRTKIEPVIIEIQSTSPHLLFTKIHPANSQKAIAEISNIWVESGTELPFSYYFLDESYEQKYLTEMRMSDLYKYLTWLAVIIAALGLFALSTFAAEQRTNEIGVRKVLGASTNSIVLMLSKEFVKLVLIANLVAAPIVWYFMSRWLDGFAYKISLSPWIFVTAAAISLLIAIMTVSFQAIKAAYSNPVKSIRYE